MVEGEITSSRTMAPIATSSLTNHLGNPKNGIASNNSSTNSNLSMTSNTISIENNSNNYKGKVERPASKSRRMSSGGSRMAANTGDDAGDKNGYGRSASDSGSDWYHATAADKIASSSGATAGEGTNDKIIDTTSGIQNTYNASSNPNDQSRSSKSLTGDQDTRKGANGTELSRSSSSSAPYLDLVTYPPQDLLRILAALLHQIATANDQLRPRGGTASSGEAGDGSNSEKRHRYRERNAAPEQALASSSGSRGLTTDDSFGEGRNGGDYTGIGDDSGEGSGWHGESSEGALSSSQQLLLSRSKPTTAALGALQTPSSTLCFRARNIPSISIEAYLLRILRYCPASCEVFVSLLVYFDRMSKMGQGQQDRTNTKSDERSGGENASRMSSDEKEKEGEGVSDSQIKEGGESVNGVEDEDDGLFVGMRGFAIDSFNVHRLVIAGVTVASKFFSDVFYTNSRYAKVGGLPVHELNQLELQFLLLNNFNLMIPLDEMQRYANQLLVYGGASNVSPQLSRAVLAANNLPAERTDKDKDAQTLQRQDGDGSESVNIQHPAPPVASTEPPASPHPEPSDQHGDTAMREA